MNALSLTFTIVFGFASVYFYLKSRRQKRPTFIVDTDVLQTKTHPRVNITFDGESIENLSRTRVVFYNAGQDAIRATDIPNNTFPSIGFDPSVRLFSVQVLAVSTSAIAFTATSRAEPVVEIRFAFLNPGDGGVIEILYDRAGDWWTAPSPQLSAAIIGSGPPQVSRYYYPPKRSDLITPAIGVLAMLAVAGISIGSAAVHGGWLGIAVGIPALFIAAAAVWYGIVQPVNRVAPAFARPIWEQRMAELLADLRKRLGA